MTQKEMVIDAITELPDDVSLGQIAERIEFLAGVIRSVTVLKSTGIAYLDARSVSWIKSKFRVRSGASGQAAFPMTWRLWNSRRGPRN